MAVLSIAVRGASGKHRLTTLTIRFDQFPVRHRLLTIPAHVTADLSLRSSPALFLLFGIKPLVLGSGIITDR